MRSRKTRDPEGARNAILDAAMARFGEFGFEGTSLEAVASDSGLAKSLVLYHFQSKRGLWDAVLDKRVRPLMAVVDRFFEEAEGLDLEDIVRARFELMRKNPQLQRLLAWMSLDAGEMDPNIRERVRRLRARMSQPGSGLPPGVDPAMFLIVLLSAMDGFFRFRSVYAEIGGMEVMGAAAEKQFLETLASMAFPCKESSR
ncbi:MAG: TetR family transcriptional regulator [Fimbriimonadaceae bacterium]|nr:TetR family transcriptional regulator [Chthonomonadaceae bacterium]MCO5296639.1 TetR family transcriptional regulator [Fimbriimonadaceae bacterium]